MTHPQSTSFRGEPLDRMKAAHAGPRSLRVNIVSWDSGGLSTDIDVITRVLHRAGCDVFFKSRRLRTPRHRVQSLLMTARVIAQQRWAVLSGRPQFDLNLHIESIFPEYLTSARVNGLFVHPEFFRDINLAHLSRLDFLLCKTASGVDAMRGLSVNCRDVSFTSPDKKLDSFVRTEPLKCLHVSGQSAVKGTEAVVTAWSRHPEWPDLTVIRRSRRYGGEPAPPLPELPNVRYETQFVPESRLRELQNGCEVHVIPSQAEAYGHVIGEAMACGALVVTTDAPPMNELVTADRGILVRVARTEPMSRSTKNFVDIEDLEAKLTAVFAMSREQRAAVSRRARAWFEEQDQRFERRLRAFLDEVRGCVADGTRPVVPTTPLI